ncbi:MAG TPA: DUF1684 domain-containing protein [Actinocrinis sp.]|jgi:hypothetical protein|uniref:DUF1684 domain-containing protein n=1 Tax=Actinocrinis sp. TaxID=1920516 RepID=UPI002DDDBC7C|nr:DUF1684 domain-containing protein [Actinocrinis sp.]HEV3170455.1 DUF1684 domain-containing protein [Actinocrinis sp.]
MQNSDSDARYVREWREWRAGWEQFLAQPHGWLAVASLNWVEDVPQQYPGHPGVWWQEGDKLYVDPQGQTMSSNGESFTDVRAFDLTAAADDTRIVAGDLEIGITYRDQYLLVTYDPLAAARTEFRGVPTYAPDPRWVLKGRLEAHATQKSVSFDTVGAEKRTYSSPGTIRFGYAGGEHTLTPTIERDAIVIVFTDATSGVTTYGACRSLSVPTPDEDGTVVLDFNRALNLPCAFSDMPVCPVAPLENRLPFAVEAGEKLPYRKTAAGHGVRRGRSHE